MQTRKWPKRLGIAIAAVVLIACIGFFAYVSDYYHAGSYAQSLSEELTETGELQEADSYIAVGSEGAEAGIVLYPGAKVDPAAYLPLAAELSERGYYCVIAKMPFNLAIFGIDAANSLMDDVSDVNQWWIAGHSMGGAMAAQFASGHEGELRGVFLLAAYSASDLAGSGLEVVTMYGGNDGVLNCAALEENAGNLPKDAQTVVIEGGNHAGFGDYGPQDGDGACVIGAERQWADAVDVMDAAIQKELAASA